MWTVWAEIFLAHDFHLDENAHHLPREVCMSKSRDIKKDVKKKPQKSIKEKRLEKQAKKAQKTA